MVKVVINDFIMNLYSKIIGYSGEELRDFYNLTLDERDDILTETFVRRFKAFWNSESRSTAFKKEQVLDEDKKVVDFSFAVRAKKLDLVITIGFNFDAYQNAFEIRILEDKSTSMTGCLVCGAVLENELQEIKELMETRYSERMFIRDFFATLHARRITEVTSAEAQVMYEIYNRALMSYPLFKKLSLKQRVEVLEKGYLRGRTRRFFAHDAYGFAKSTFEQLDKAGLIKRVVFGSQSELAPGKEGTLVYESRKDRRNPENISEVWEEDCLIYATYEYTALMGDKIRVSYHPSELWLLLAQP